jgi:hypothetical protein
LRSYPKLPLTFHEEVQELMNEMAAAYRACNGTSLSVVERQSDGQWLIKICSLTSDEPPLLE